MLQDSVWEEQSSLITSIDSSWEIYLWIWAGTQRKDVVLESRAPCSGGCCSKGGGWRTRCLAAACTS